MPDRANGVRGSTPPFKVKVESIGNYMSPLFKGARVINLLSKRGDEGQSRTDTGSQVRLGPMVKDQAVGSVAVKRGLRYTAGKGLLPLKPGNRCVSCESPFERLEVL